MGRTPTGFLIVFRNKPPHPVLVTYPPLGARFVCMAGDPQRISTTMALDAIEDISNEIEELRHALQRKLDTRDAMIQDAKRSGIRYATLGKRSRLSLKRLQAIVARHVPENTL